MTENNHNVIIRDREKIQLTGILKIDSFNESVFNLETNLGLVEISGNHLEVQNIDIDKGEISINGYVTRVEYHDSKHAKKKTESFLKKLIK